MLKSSLLGSTKTGFRSFCVIDKILAMYVFAGTITSSPDLIFFNFFHAFRVKLKASKPFPTPTQYLVPQYLANSFQNSYIHNRL